jgi:hypothetical protein
MAAWPRVLRPSWFHGLRSVAATGLSLGATLAGTNWTYAVMTKSGLAVTATAPVAMMVRRNSGREIFQRRKMTLVRSQKSNFALSSGVASVPPGDVVELACFRC